MTPTAHDPLTLIKGVVSARHRQEIEYPGYKDALGVLDRHFAVYEQRLRVMAAPSSFPDGEILLEAAGQGLEQLRQAVAGLTQLDPVSLPDQAEALVEEAASGFRLLSQLQDVTEEKKAEFEEAYREYQENGPEIG